MQPTYYRNDRHKKRVQQLTRKIWLRDNALPLVGLAFILLAYLIASTIEFNTLRALGQL